MIEIKDRMRRENRETLLLGPNSPGTITPDELKKQDRDHLLVGNPGIPHDLQSSLEAILSSFSRSENYRAGHGYSAVS
jgi:hypothetical protein